MTLEGRVIVVTGGSRGIGRACVLDAISKGARVVFCSRHEDEDRKEVEDRSRALGGPDAVYSVTADIAVEADVVRLFEAARERYGAVHGVVNNAAVSREALLVTTDTADWDAVLDVNLTGSFLVARQAIRTFLDLRQGGRIVSIGTLAQYGVAGNVSYAVSKGGLEGLGRRITRDYSSRGITATTVICGSVETTMSENLSEGRKRALIDGCPMRRQGTPEEIASVVSFLLSDVAHHMTSPTLFAAGGLHEVPPY